MFSNCHVRVSSLVFDLACSRLGVVFPHEFIVGFHDGVKYADHIPVYITVMTSRNRSTRVRVFHHTASLRIPYCLYLQALLKYLDGEYYTSGVLLGLAVHILQDITTRHRVYKMSEIKLLKNIHRKLENTIYTIIMEKVDINYVISCIDGRLNINDMFEQKVCEAIRQTYDLIVKFVRQEVPKEGKIFEITYDLTKLDRTLIVREIVRNVVMTGIIVFIAYLTYLWSLIALIFLSPVLAGLFIYSLVKTVRSCIKYVRLVRDKVKRNFKVCIGSAATKRDLIVRELLDKCEDVYVNEELIKSGDVIRQLVRRRSRKVGKRRYMKPIQHDQKR